MDKTRIAVPGGDIACAYDGPTEGPALAFLHGWTLDHRMWRLQLAAFAGARLVVAPDRRGFGLSTAPADLAREPEDVARILDHFGAERAVIVGMSQAGRVALEFALRFGDRMAGLVLQGASLATVAPPEPSEAIPLSDYTALVHANHLSDMKANWRAHRLMRTVSETARVCVAEILDSYDGRDLLAGGAPLPERSTEFARISAPALIVTGADDTTHRRRCGDGLARALRHAQRIEIADAGHLCNLCRPDQYNRVLADFLQRCLV
jgi:pimeloyl-ACP methyl ester carboxylesterase